MAFDTRANADTTTQPDSKKAWSNSLSRRSMRISQGDNLMLIYVDDILLASRDHKTKNDMKKNLSQEFDKRPRKNELLSRNSVYTEW